MVYLTPMEDQPQDITDVIASRHAAEALLREALERQATATTRIGSFVAGRIVSYREKKVDGLVSGGSEG